MRILIIDDENVDKLKRKLTSLNHEVKHIPDPEAAFDYVLSNKWTIDLILLDENLGEPIYTDTIYPTGRELAKAINHKGEVYVPIISFTGKLYDVKTAVELFAFSGVSYFISKTEFERDVKKSLDLFCELRSVKDKWALKKAKKHVILHDIFNNLEDDQLKKLEDDIQLRVNLKTSEVSFNDGFIQWQELFEGYLDMSQLSHEKFNNEFLKLLNRVKVQTIFTGKDTWMDENSIVRVLLKNYLSQDARTLQKSRDQINIRSINLLLDILRILSDDVTYKKGNKNVNLSSNNVLKRVARKCSKGKKDNHRIFIDKMIARKVAIGFHKLFPNGNERMPLEILCYTLQHGKTPQYEVNTFGEFTLITQKPYAKTHLLNTQLGLTHDSGIIDIEKPFILIEEFEWNQKYAKFGIELRKKLNELAGEINSLLDKHELNSSEFNEFDNYFVDMEDLRDFIDAIYRKQRKIFLEVISLVEVNIFHPFKSYEKLFKTYLLPV